MTHIVEKGLGPEYRIDMADVDRCVRIVKVPQYVAEQWEKAQDGTEVGEVIHIDVINNQKKEEKKLLFALKEGVKYQLDEDNMTTPALVFRMHDEQRRCAFLGRSENMVARQYIDRSKPTRGAPPPPSARTSRPQATLNNDPYLGERSSKDNQGMSFAPRAAGGGSNNSNSNSSNNNSSSSSSSSSNSSSALAPGAKRKLDPADQDKDNIRATIHIKLKSLFALKPRYLFEEIKDYLNREIQSFDQNAEQITKDLLSKFYFRHERGDYRHYYEMKVA